ncbi:MAG: hypothetical protein J0H83_06430 [Candidatus Melainabacteria bacterium]|nr:hypothetical protein [Candidatus Melainabacteria bacterium]
MKSAVVCIAADLVAADAIVEGLKATGFTSNEISILFPDRSGKRDLGYEKHTKAPEGASAGTCSGAILGGAVGWLTGIGILTIPGAGPFIAAGPLMAALGGMAVGGTIGGLTGAMVGFGIPEYEAKQYAGKLTDGNIFISVHCEDNKEAMLVEQIFKKNGVRDINRMPEQAVRRAA